MNFTLPFSRWGVGKKCAANEQCLVWCSQERGTARLRLPLGPVQDCADTAAVAVQDRQGWGSPSPVEKPIVPPWLCPGPSSAPAWAQGQGVQGQGEPQARSARPDSQSAGLGMVGAHPFGDR